MILFIYVVAVLAIYIAYAYKKFNDKVAKSNHIPGDPVLPFFGNAFRFLFKSPCEITDIIISNPQRLGDCFRVLFGSQLIVVFTNPKDVEVLLSSQTLLDKAPDYDNAKEWFGEGLIFSTGKKWFTRRRIITPTFHFKILDQFVEVFDKNSKIMIKQMASHKGQTVDIYPFLNLCALDSICETSLGISINAQINSDSSYVTAVKELNYIFNERFMNIFMQNSTFFKLTPTGRRWKKLVKEVHKFSVTAIKRRREELTKKQQKVETTEDDDVGAKKKLALLDILLQATADGKPLSDEDIREEVDTFAFAGHDTTTSAMTFCCYTIAKYPEVQQKVFEEIRNVISDDKEKIVTIQDLNNLHYLEKVIKETMRIFPPVPSYGRNIKQDVEINGKLIPADTSVVVSIIAMGRSEKLWKNPNEFNPERFEADNMEGLHAYQNVVFSAGPRNCIGQKFAMLEVKSTISKILRHYEISIENGYEPRLYREIVLMPENGMKIKFKDREYKA